MEQNERQLWAEAVAATLRAERAVAGLDQAAIARPTGIARSSYRFYEQAARNPDVVQLAMIAEAFGVTFAYLMSEVDRRAPRQGATVTPIRKHVTVDDLRGLARVAVHGAGLVSKRVRSESSHPLYFHHASRV